MPIVNNKASIKARNLVQTNDDLQRLVANVARHAPHGSEPPKIGKHHSNILDEAYPEASFSTVYTMEVSPEERALAANMDMAHVQSKLPPHNDSHMHPWSYIQKGINLEEMLLRMDMIHCKHSVLMPIPTSIISMQGDRVTKIWPPGDKDTFRHHCGPSYYIPDAHNRPDLEMTPEILTELESAISLHVDSEVDDFTADQFKLLEPKEQDKLDPMITGLHLGSMFADVALFKKLLRHPGVFTGAGELTLNKEIVENLYAGGVAAQASLHPVAGPGRDDTNILPTKQLMAALGVVGMPACIHCDVGDWRDPPSAIPKNMEAFDNFLSDPRVIDTTIIWAHAGGLGRFVKQPDNHLKALGEMLDTHPNLALDISWNEVAKQLTGEGFDDKAAEKRTEEWAAFLEKHSERVMFGSDTLAPINNAIWTRTLITYAGLLAKLSDEARLNILEKSYEKYYIDARTNVRRFENVVLPCIADKLTDPTVLHLDINAIKAIRDRLYEELDPSDLSSERSITSEEMELSLNRVKMRAKFTGTLEKLIKSREQIGIQEIEIVRLREENSKLQATVAGITAPVREALTGQPAIPPALRRQVDVSTQSPIRHHLGPAIRERIEQLQSDARLEITFLTPAARIATERTHSRRAIETRDAEILRLSARNTELQASLDNLRPSAMQAQPDQYAAVPLASPEQQHARTLPPQHRPLAPGIRARIAQLKESSHKENTFSTDADPRR
ncbi:amidohydrolase family protein [Actimicrobium sp. CCI2.3]|uniref:amidohydrolase family protein n=1 Tax=Actimicrobium sp. CCI2.3 TaxID=3048616 RepID=UPI002AB37EC6|nr:amidohydrolase family protein [Actimicrobium sp. CCI2.3]MDY7575330.1 amidohydrolase family protein [Actimicrobium sp. CCI2.3]MEB0023678.1 amidohydrolase family protein [Actimicrobium sp. CCI2.3]